jgi:EAL domain-containing protein (putative c-di-GMP-specific phosphodiesterase class I)/glycosyltransferase involved in cell wall biosynthesis/ActR/RegA family two-component response regulator
MIHLQLHPLRQVIQSVGEFPQSCWRLIISAFGQSSTTERIGFTDRPSEFRLKLITQFYPPDFAATGQFMDELAQNLAQQGVDVQVFTAQPGYAFAQENAPDRERMGEVWVERSNFLRGGSRRWAGRTFTSLAFCAHAIWHLLQRQHRGDILFLTSEPPFLQVVGLLMNWLFGTRFVTLIYDLYPEVAVELDVLDQNHGLIRFWNIVNKQVWDTAEAIVVPCQTMKDRIVKRHPDLVDKITVIHNWADPTWIQPIVKANNPFVQEHNLQDKFVVLYSGNMGRCHDMDTIVAAAQVLKAEPVEFMFVGGGPKREVVQQQIQALGLENCTFLPYQDKSCLPLSLTAGDLSLVSVDVGMEGLVAPSKFYSALCAGRPVAIICEPHSYLRALVSDANCGAAFRNGDGQGLADFIRHLAHDRAMADRMGKCGYRYIQEYFTPGQISQQYFRILHRAVVNNADLYQAIEQNNFQVVYQPIANLGNQKISGIEASIRWQHPTRGLICPAEFAASVEESGLGLSLSWWFLAEVCRQLQSWQTQGIALQPRLSINLSHQVFNHPELIMQLDTLISLYQINPASLQLEIDDSAAMADASAFTATLLQLKARNINVCISNFGESYSSLDYIHRFQINALKISPSLIGRISLDPEIVKLLETIVILSKDLSMQVIAKGIESNEELHRLREIGIQYGQGHQLFPPVTAMEMSLALIAQPNKQLIAPTPMTLPELDVSQADAPLVLIADDDRSMRSILKSIIQKAGYRVIEASNGKIALELFQTHQPDLVLLDAMMPEMDGFTCCHELQSLSQIDDRGNIAVAVKPIPVLLITALDDPESINAAFDAGAIDYVTKPINWIVLQQRIMRLLS